MERRAKVELLEQIRREYEFGVGTVKGARKPAKLHRLAREGERTRNDPPDLR
jgi:hypothetical protein